MPPSGVFVPAACKRSERHWESWGSLEAGDAPGSWPKRRDVCIKSPIQKTKDVLTCVTVFLPSLLSSLAAEVAHGGRTHSALHSCGDSLAPQLGAGLSLVHQPGSPPTQRPGIRWKQLSDMWKNAIQMVRNCKWFSRLSDSAVSCWVQAAVQWHNVWEELSQHTRKSKAFWCTWEQSSPGQSCKLPRCLYVSCSSPFPPHISRTNNNLLKPCLSTLPFSHGIL